MNLPQLSQRAGGATRLSGIVRLVRRICVLRERGESAAATQLEENEFETAVQDYRLTEGPAALPVSELEEIFLTEERRVADAAVLAELLVPQLAARLANGPGAGQAAGVSPGIRHDAGVPIVRPATEAPSGSLAIPDLLDAMLAADSAAHRQSAARRTGR